MEGSKSVLELIHSDFNIQTIYATSEWIEEHSLNLTKAEIVEVTESDIQKISYFKTASSVLCVVDIPQFNPNINSYKWTMVLDGINDPGNLGTLVRIADWYGIKDIICSEDTVDMFNPKTISATMGSFTRVNVIYRNLNQYMIHEDRPIYFTLMSGTPVHELKNPQIGSIVIGSEAHGIRDELMEIGHIPITIKGKGKAESLNAGVAAGIICDRLTQST